MFLKKESLEGDIGLNQCKTRRSTLNGAESIIDELYISGAHAPTLNTPDLAVKHLPLLVAIHHIK